MNLHGILIVDKPRGMTSHDVVVRIRRLINTRKVGHAGTLDPAAEGVLVVAIGRATRLLSSLSTSTKRYSAHVVLGIGSASGDIEGPVESATEPSPQPSVDDVKRSLRRFVGEIDQRPPSYSAIKVGGQPIYRRARRGETVDAPVRRVTIRMLRLLRYEHPDLFLEVECSAGTYLRSLARDIGQVLGSGAYLHYLLRTRSGTFSLPEAWSMDELEQRLNPESFAMFARHPALVRDESVALLLDSGAASAWYDGRPVTAHQHRENGFFAHAFRDDGTWLGAGDYDADRDVYHPRIVVHA